MAWRRVTSPRSVAQCAIVAPTSPVRPGHLRALPRRSARSARVGTSAVMTVSPRRATRGRPRARTPPCPVSGSTPLVLLPGHLLDLRAVVLAVVGQAVAAEEVVADLCLRLRRHVGVADGDRVDVRGPVALVRRAVPGGEADLTQ